MRSYKRAFAHSILLDWSIVEGVGCDGIEQIATRTNAAPTALAFPREGDAENWNASLFHPVLIGCDQVFGPISVGGSNQDRSDVTLGADLPTPVLACCSRSRPRCDGGRRRGEGVKALVTGRRFPRRRTA